MSDTPATSRLVIVSNRLPVSVSRNEAGGFDFKESAGGLATGLAAYLAHQRRARGGDFEHVWMGWPGIELAGDAEQEAVTARLAADHQCAPVFLPAALADDFYHGFCNNTIWPLFHYFYVYSQFEARLWDAYVAANERFCDAVVAALRPGDSVWVHDYHLMLLPALLRRRMPDLPIGFFLHIPFPSFETFRLLPREWGRAILEGLLGADVIGFHTHDYTQYYLRCVLRILGLDHTLGTIELEDRSVKVDTFPMGIEFDKYNGAATSDEAAAERQELERHLAGRRAIVSVDRLDYTKGILNRLEAYDMFLARHPEWRERVVLVLVVVPSREAVRQYELMKQQIDQQVGLINGRYGTMGWTPILYQYRYLSLIPLVAAYAVSDVALVTPLRDGMNLIAKEYVASCADGRGVLVLSEMAGAAAELGEAIIVNPNSRDEICEALHASLKMEPAEQERRNAIMRKRLETYNVVRWADDFTSAMQATSEVRRAYGTILIAGQRREELLDAFRRARRRLVLTDYDGTLVGFHGDPLMARPTEWLLEMLRKLAAQQGTSVVLVSGRLRATLEEWLGCLSVGFAAEHGAYIRDCGSEWRTPLPLRAEWKDQVRPILQVFSDRLPGAFVEEKDFSIVWHYRRSDPELGGQRARELMDSLVQFTANMNIQVLPGSRVVEVRSAKVNKGVAAEHFVETVRPDFMLAIGDDWTDEDMFRALPPDAWTVKVGLGRTAARYALRNHREAVDLLGRLAEPS